MQVIDLGSDGIVEVSDEASRGHVNLFACNAQWAEPIGMYDCVNDALADIAALALKRPYTKRWAIQLACPEIIRIPVFDSSGVSAGMIGEARTIAEADAVLAPRKAQYCADGFGPRGHEGWVPMETETA